MKIKDKRSSFFILTSKPTNMSFAYLDEIDFGGILSSRSPDLSGTDVPANDMRKVDADRPFIIFTTAADDVAVDCLITSSSGVTYTATAAGWIRPEEGACFLIPGIKRGDFVKIELK